MADVQAGLYTNSGASVVASGGSLPALTDAETGKPVDIIISPKKLISNSEVITVPSQAGTTTVVSAEPVAEATVAEAAPSGEEKKEEGAEAAPAAGEEAQAQTEGEAEAAPEAESAEAAGEEEVAEGGEGEEEA